MVETARSVLDDAVSRGAGDTAFWLNEDRGSNLQRLWDHAVRVGDRDLRPKVKKGADVYDEAFALAPPPDRDPYDPPDPEETAGAGARGSPPGRRAVRL